MDAAGFLAVAHYVEDRQARALDSRPMIVIGSCRARARGW
jgi:hypothetical protein